MRGAALVDRVVEAFATGEVTLAALGGVGLLKPRDPEPLAADVLAGLRLPGGGPLPDSLTRWLAFDARELPDLLDGDRLVGHALIDSVP